DPSSLVNNGTDTLVLRFFAEELTMSGCLSNERSLATITILPSPRLSTHDQPGACFGKSFDLTTINVLDENGLNGTISYYGQTPFISGNEIGPVVLPTATTTYYVLSEATNGCRDTLPVVYSVQPGPVAHIPDASTLCRLSSKWISVEDNGNGNGPYQYAWNTGADSSAIEIFSDEVLGTVNTYAVTLTDAGGCSSSDTLEVTTIENIEQLLASSTSVTTCNGSNGSVSVTPLSGNPPFTYEWSGGIVANQPGGLTVTGLSQGSYSFTVTDSSPEQCRAVVPTVVVNGPAAIVLVDEVTHVSCHGGNDGCISLLLFGGSNNAVVSWDNGMTGPNICGLPAGEYTATVTESGCENIITIPVNQPEALVVNPSIAPASCFGGNNGAISLTIFGGTSPHAIWWEDGSTTSELNDLTAGNYAVTVTDANNCELVLPQIEVPQPAQINLSAIETMQPTCNGFNNGSIHVEAGGGIGPYSYTWDNGGTGSSISNIAAGDYTVQVRDQNGCLFNQTIALAAPQLLQVVPDEVNAPTCAGLENGYIYPEVSGGTGTFSFLWNNGSTAPQLTNIGIGSYSVTVTDENGCVASTTFPEIESPSLLHPVINQSPAFCIGRDENCLEIVVTGGMPPYLFDWSTDDSDPVLCGLSHGHYTVTITDSNGCKATKTAIIDSIQVLTLGYEAFPPLCNGQTGQLAMTVAGGMEPYSVVWSDGQTGLVASNLLAQNHAATVTDANGCSNTLGIIPLEEPAVLEANLVNLEGIACHNGSEGAIDIEVNGGTLPYSFLWTNGHTTEDLTGIPEGTYSVAIRDENGCIASIQGLVVDSPEPLRPTADLEVPTSSNCQTLQVDNVCVNMTGGVGPYQFSWETGDTTECINNPLPGDYHVTITDAVGCTTELMSVKVPEEYFAISVQSLPGQPTVCFGDSTGLVNFTIQGGVAPYQFNWSNGITGLTSASIISNSDLPIGNYKVTITDNTGCTAVSPISNISSFGRVIPTVDNNQVTNVSCKHGMNGVIPLHVTGGLEPYTYHWTNSAGDPLPGGQTIYNLTGGMYFVTVSDQMGCTGSVSSIVLEPTTEFLLPPPTIQNVACYGQSTGSVFVMPMGGDLPYHYLWSPAGVANGDTTQFIHGLPIGNYTLTATDKNGCSRTATYSVNSPEAPISVTVLDAEDVSCFGYNDGFIDIQIDGGTPNYSVNWGTISGEEDLTDAPSGDYLLSIFDAEGCHYQSMYSIGTPDLLVANTTVQNQTQLSPPNGSASVAPTGGTAPYQITWSNGSHAPVITGLVHGIYSVTVTDAEFCSTIQFVEVDLMLATGEGSQSDAITIAPNPTSGKVYLKGLPSNVSNLDLQVFNALGQLVLLQSDATVMNGELELDLSAQAPGLYQIVAIEKGEVVFQGKLVVER
ncbi:MAG: T9SS type A sorting domain-containing protein, partial [Saprospiraceae bacterium]|nr:T9SS type A sorting domain-containing protein [Saprospiraceae bacterium]